MKTSPARRGFTYVEMLFVLAIVAVLAAIGIPRYFRAQTHARQSEAITNLKTLATNLRLQQNPPFSIHLPGFNPPRGNRYSYHTAQPCWSSEDRSSYNAMWNSYDSCIGVDVFDNYTFPSLFTPVPIVDYYWYYETDWGFQYSNLGSTAGIFGSCGDPQWEFLVYAAGDVDDDPSDSADTWLAASADGYLSSVCPSSVSTQVPAGEPFMVNDDSVCN